MLGMYKPTRQKAALYNIARLLWGSVGDKFHLLYYAGRHETWDKTRWLGTKVQKCPFDLWVYQEIIYEVQPDLIIETGTAEGGSAAFMASICELADHGRVVTIDKHPSERRPDHPRISYVTGSSTDSDVVTRIYHIASSASSVMVVLDSNHSKSHVLTEMRLYSELVTPGSYLIVEDTNLNGRPVKPDFGPGPGEAVDEFLVANGTFEVDRSREKFGMSFNPGGYLRRRT
jgi:cephalosporin hydroxylase